jgi:hypothetical protein
MRRRLRTACEIIGPGGQLPELRQLARSQALQHFRPPQFRLSRCRHAIGLQHLFGQELFELPLTRLPG